LFQVFLTIEKKYFGTEKIKQQIKILNDYDLLPLDFSFNGLVKTSQKLKNNSVFNNGCSNLLFAGPMIVSHFVPFGRIYGTSFNRYWFYYTFNKNFNLSLLNTGLDGVIGALPVYVGFSFKPVFVTAVGYNVPQNYQGLLFPFFEVLLPCFGFSLRVISSDNDLFRYNVLFEYNLDLCFVGFLKG